MLRELEFAARLEEIRMEKAVWTDAYLWKNGAPIDLAEQIDSNSGWGRLHKADQINNQGVIAGRSPLRFRGVTRRLSAPAQNKIPRSLDFATVGPV